MNLEPQSDESVNNEFLFKNCISTYFLYNCRCTHYLLKLLLLLLMRKDYFEKNASALKYLFCKLYFSIEKIITFLVSDNEQVLILNKAK
jgi:hypothetical protein